MGIAFLFGQVILVDSQHRDELFFILFTPTCLQEKHLEITINLISWLVKPVSDRLNYKIECLIVDLAVAIFRSSVKISTDTCSTSLKSPWHFSLPRKRRRLYIKPNLILKDLCVKQLEIVFISKGLQNMKCQCS